MKQSVSCPGWICTYNKVIMITWCFSVKYKGRIRVSLHKGSSDLSENQRSYDMSDMETQS